MKRIIYALSIALACFPAMAQVPVKPVVVPHVTFTDSIGSPCAGCKLYTYSAGTTTPLATYTDATGSSQNTNPIVLDVAGGANIWTGANAYKFILKDTLGATLWTVDQVNTATFQTNGSNNGSQILLNLVGGDNVTVTNSGGSTTISVTGAVVTAPSATQTIVQPPGTSSNVNVFNNVEDASQFAGADIGAQINAAFAACPVTQSCKVTLPPGNNYSYATMFTIPGSLPFSALDCQGSGLTFTGTGDASTVASENVNDASGYIANCFYYNGTGNTSSVNAIHQLSRNAFSYRDVSIDNFTNATSSGILLDNVAESWGGYNERTRLQNVTFSLNTKGLRLLGSNGGTNSFARLVVQGSFCNASDGQICLSAEGDGTSQSAFVYNTYIDLRGNLSTLGGTAPRAVSATNGGSITGVMNLGFEGPSNSYLTYIDANFSAIDTSGNSNGNSIPSFNAATSSSVITPNLTQQLTLQAPPFHFGVAQANNPKLLWDWQSLRFGIPVLGGNPNGYEQIFSRVTDTTPEVDAEPSTGSTQINIRYCVVAGCGFGPGYGPSSTRGGTLVPTHPLEYIGGFGSHDGKFDVDSTGRVTAAGIYTGSTSSTNLAGNVTLSAGSGTFTFNPIFTVTPICVATDTIALNPVKVSASVTTLTITGTGTDVINWICIGRVKP